VPPLSGRARQRRLAAVITPLLAAVIALAGCGGPGATASRSPSSSVSAGASTPAGSIPSSDPIGTPFTPPWPAGWNDAFCGMFGEMVVMQELAVDIGRALAEDDRDDALALTRELAGSAAAVREQLAALPVWATAGPLGEDIVALLDLADEMALRYERYLAQNRNPARGLAEAAAEQMGEVVPDLLDKLILLSEMGLACAGLTFNLETPGQP
jgi:hypothetical protein